MLSRASTLRALLLPGVLGVAGALAALAGGEAAPRYPDHSKLLLVRGGDGSERPVRTAEDWQARRAHILLGMEEVMGPLAGPVAKPGAAGADLDLRVEGEEPLEKFVRKRVSFLALDGGRVPAYLLVPRDLRGKTAGILCLHQTTSIGKGEPAGLGGNESLRYAAHLAARGHVTLAPDYPGFGDHAFDPYTQGYVSGTMKAIRDNIRAVDLLRSLEEVDPERIGCIGHSLGGHNSVFTAAFDPRIKVVVSSCGFNAFEHYRGGNLAGWSSKTYMPRIPSYGGWKGMPFDFHEVVASLAPRPFLAVAPLGDSNFDVKGVREAMASAREVYKLLGVEERLQAEHPDCGHEFSAEMREKAYGWIEKWLEKKKE